LSLLPPPPSSTLFPYTTLFRSQEPGAQEDRGEDLPAPRHRQRAPALESSPPSEPSGERGHGSGLLWDVGAEQPVGPEHHDDDQRSEEHTSELQSRFDLVCRLLL